MLRIAVLGAGRIAKIHAANVAAHPNATLVLVADPWRAGVDALSTQLGCEAANDCATVLSREDIDAVVIGTPTDTHIDLLLAAVAQGKAVLCEKTHRPGHRQGAQRCANRRAPGRQGNAWL